LAIGLLYFWITHTFQSTNKPKSAPIINPSKISAMPIVKHISDHIVWCNLKYFEKIIYFSSAYLSPDPSPDIPPVDILNSLNNAITYLKPTYYLIGTNCNANNKL